MKRIAIVLSCLLVTLAISLMATARPFNPFTSRGADVFSLRVIRLFGGVVLAGTAEILDDTGKKIPPSRISLAVHEHSTSAPQVCVVLRPPPYRIFSKKHCYKLDLSPDLAIPLAKWVLTGQTGAYSIWDPEEEDAYSSSTDDEDAASKARLFATFNEDFMPKELAIKPIADLLNFIDFDLSMQPVNTDDMRAKYNARLGPDFDPDSSTPEDGSYLNTDVDTKYIARLTEDSVVMGGFIYRYHWVAYEENSDYPFISLVERACNPDSMSTLDADASENGDWSGCAGDRDQVKQQRDALTFARTTAFFRTLADRHRRVLVDFVNATQLH